ncbi:MULTISPECIES: hypothetical protein [unclassified Pseudomonas]|uniref:hypothetical protein n=1 Tax=unclassified Pseudomonas TaxID=196821 RepID=UPI00131BD108|nr:MULTISPECIES: hypothetical protein [unclassified Pseudomonas]
MMREQQSEARECLEKLGFQYAGELIGPDGQVLEARSDHNLIPIVGFAHIAGTAFIGTTPLVSNWYLGLIVSNVVPDKTYKAANLPSIEGASYSATTRPQWVGEWDGTSSIDNLDSYAQFAFPSTLTADVKVYGAFLVSESQKGSAAGTLLSIARFSSPYTVPAGSTFKLGVGITLATS